MIDLIASHPAEFYLLVTAIVSIIHLFVEPRWPAAARFLDLLKSAGLDLPRVYSIARELAPRLPPMMFGVIAFLMLNGCASRIDVAIGAANGIDDVDRLVADEIATKCTPAYREANSLARVAEIDKQCLPLASAYKLGKGAEVDLQNAIKAYQKGGAAGLLAEAIQEATDAVDFVKRALEETAR